MVKGYEIMQTKQEYIRCRIRQLLIQYIRIYSSYLEAVFPMCNIVMRDENFTGNCFREAVENFTWKT
jgi:hypothetical protein